MAAERSAEPQQWIRSEELEEPEVMTEKHQSTCGQFSANEDIVIPEDSFPDRESIGGDGFCSQTETGPLKSTAGDDVAAKDSSVGSEDEKALNTNTSSRERHFHWSESEEDTGNAHEFTKDNGNKASKDDEDKALEMKDISNAEETGKEKSLSDEEMSPVKGSCEELEGDEEEEDEGKEGEEKTVRQRKSRLRCKECGKRFTRRETFNLHRHTHTHKDELVTLTCKECGLSFQHRSSLIKHRSEHREKEEQAINQQRETQLRYQCEYCGMTFSTLHKLKGHVCSSSSESYWDGTSDSDKPFRCPLCRKEFYFKWCMTKHIQSHSMLILFHCQECDKGFTDGKALQIHHQRCHSGLKPYECPDCGMAFKHHSVMEDHQRKHTQPTRLHQCRICSKTFKYSSLLHQHQYLHTGHRCLECGRTFAFAQNLKDHCRQHKLRPHRPHACQICPLSFSDRDSLQAHVISHETVGRPSKENSNQIKFKGSEPNCPLCLETFPTPADLCAHMLIHEGEYERVEAAGCKNQEAEDERLQAEGCKNTHPCHRCPLSFSDQSSLRTHISSHEPPPFNEESVPMDLKFRGAAPLNTGNVPERWRGDDMSTRWGREDMSTKPLKCPDCGKAFRHHSILQLHVMRFHSKTKPYQCKVCHKSFRTNNYLRQHVIIHTRAGPYKCPDCTRVFAFLKTLKSHQKQHQQKPFRCTQCHKGFIDNHHLQRHIQSHNRPYKCSACNKIFRMECVLREHMKTHTGEAPHRRFGQPRTSQKELRIRSRDSRGRKGGRLSWPRLMGGSATPTPQDLPPYQVPVSRYSESETKTARSPQKTQMDLQFSDSDSDSEGRQQREQWMPEDQPPPVRWQVEGGQLRPVAAPQHHRSAPQQQQQQRSPGWTATPSSPHPDPSPAQNLEPRPVRESGTTVLLTKPLSEAVPKSSSVRVSEFPPNQAPVSRDSEREMRTERPPQKTQLDLQFSDSDSDSDSEGRQQREDQPPPVRWRVEGGQLRPVSVPQHHRSDSGTSPLQNQTKVQDILHIPPIIKASENTVAPVPSGTSNIRQIDSDSDIAADQEQTEVNSSYKKRPLVTSDSTNTKTKDSLTKTYIFEHLNQTVKEICKNCKKEINKSLVQHLNKSVKCQTEYDMDSLRKEKQRNYHRSRPASEEEAQERRTKHAAVQRASRDKKMATDAQATRADEARRKRTSTLKLRESDS